MWGTLMVPRPGSSNVSLDCAEGWFLALLVGWGQEINNSQSRPGTPSLVSTSGTCWLGKLGWNCWWGIHEMENNGSWMTVSLACQKIPVVYTVWVWATQSIKLMGLMRLGPGEGGDRPCSSLSITRLWGIGVGWGGI